MRTKRVTAKREGIVKRDDNIRPQRGCTETGTIIPDEVQVEGSPVYKVVKRLGKGGFGQVFLGCRVSGGDENVEGPRAMEVALKFERRKCTCCTERPLNEWEVYNNLGDTHGVPKVHYKGQIGQYNVMVMDILGSSLRDIWKSSGKCMPVEMVACIAVECLSILAEIHSKGYVHRDIKPENLLLGKPSSIKEKKLFLVDFGLATRWRDTTNNQHVEYAQFPHHFSGTIQYASVHTLLGRTYSRRDDLESLAYTLIFLLQGQLPWQNLQGDEIELLVAKRKMSTSPDVLCSSCPDPFRQFLETVIELKFDEEPNYFKLISMFDALVRANHSILPLQIGGAQKVIQLYKQWSTLDGNDEEQPRKRVRTGHPASIFLSVFKNKKQPIKQRYFRNITDDRLHEVVEDGYQQGFFISAVAFSYNSWTVVMDDATSFTDQVFDLAPTFLHTEWIEEKQSKNYHISSLAGATTNGKALIVMSRGTSFPCQCLLVHSSFPFESIRKKWKEGLHVTSMATTDSCWAIVMSQTSNLDQVVELDFHYPSEGVNRHVEKGYQVTSTAATNDQIAVVLSRPKSELDLNCQLVLGAPDLSEKTIQKYWAKGWYLSCLCYGRTLF